MTPEEAGARFTPRPEARDFSLTGEPVVLEHGDRIEVTWPTGRKSLFWCTPQVVEAWADAVNRARTLRSAAVTAINVVGLGTGDRKFYRDTITALTSVALSRSQTLVDSRSRNDLETAIASIIDAARQDERAKIAGELRDGMFGDGMLP